MNNKDKNQSNLKLLISYLNDPHYLDENSELLESIEGTPALNFPGEFITLVSPLYTILSLIKESRIKKRSDTATSVSILIALNELCRSNNCIIKATDNSIALEFEDINRFIEKHNKCLK